MRAAAAVRSGDLIPAGVLYPQQRKQLSLLCRMHSFHQLRLALGVGLLEENVSFERVPRHAKPNDRSCLGERRAHRAHSGLEQLVRGGKPESCCDRPQAKMPGAEESSFPPPTRRLNATTAELTCERQVQLHALGGRKPLLVHQRSPKLLRVVIPKIAPIGFQQLATEQVRNCSIGVRAMESLGVNGGEPGSPQLAQRRLKRLQRDNRLLRSRRRQSGVRLLRVRVRRPNVRDRRTKHRHVEGPPLPERSRQQRANA